MTRDLEKLFNLLNSDLYLTCPVLSGNMRANIQVTGIEENEVTMAINAPFYDMMMWEAHRMILYTYQNFNGITDYAMWVNDEGAFHGKNTRAKHWVNRCIYDVCMTVASEIGAEVINKLDIS